MAMDPRTEQWKALWAAQRSSRYHARRQAFFDRWRLITAAVSVVFGSAAAVNVLAESPEWITLVFALGVTLLATIDLVVGTATMARTHNDLRRRFLLLEADIRKHPQPDKATVDHWCAERLTIEADEPPIYVALDVLCENELSRAHGNGARCDVKPWQKFTAHWLRWESADFEPKV